jgi:trimethylguanosine synthase
MTPAVHNADPHTATRGPDACPLGHELQRYWDRLSPQERRMRFDRVGLYSVDPQEVALHIAEAIPGPVIADAFCGVGGNAIGFARRGLQVIAIEQDPARLAMARDNAALFGVAERITFLEGDTRRLLRTLDADAVFLDPPWCDGPRSAHAQRLHLADFQPDGRELLWLAFAVTGNVVLKLPRDFPVEELAEFRRRFEVRANWTAGHLLHQCAYFGATCEACP